MGNYYQVPIFGKEFPDFFPLMLIALLFLNYFKFYKYIDKLIGNESLDDEE